MSIARQKSQQEKNEKNSSRVERLKMVRRMLVFTQPISAILNGP